MVLYLLSVLGTPPTNMQNQWIFAFFPSLPLFPPQGKISLCFLIIERFPKVSIESIIIGIIVRAVVSAIGHPKATGTILCFRLSQSLQTVITNKW